MEPTTEATETEEPLVTNLFTKPQEHGGWFQVSRSNNTGWYTSSTMQLRKRDNGEWDVNYTIAVLTPDELVALRDALSAEIDGLVA